VSGHQNRRVSTTYTASLVLQLFCTLPHSAKFCVKSVNSVYMAIIFIRIREARRFQGISRSVDPGYRSLKAAGIRRSQPKVFAVGRCGH
jgi:hypothetical protein